MFTVHVFISVKKKHWKLEGKKSNIDDSLNCYQLTEYRWELKILRLG